MVSARTNSSETIIQRIVQAPPTKKACSHFGKFTRLVGQRPIGKPRQRGRKLVDIMECGCGLLYYDLGAGRS